jgi:hypothetical protein
LNISRLRLRAIGRDLNPIPIPTATSYEGLLSENLLLRNYASVIEAKRMKNQLHPVAAYVLAARMAMDLEGWRGRRAVSVSPKELESLLQSTDYFIDQRQYVEGGATVLFGVEIETE